MEAAPVTQGFTPVNGPSAIAELSCDASATPSPTPKRKAKAGTKPKEIQSNENKKRKRSQVSKPRIARKKTATAPSTRNAKASISEGTQNSRDISKGLPQKKPGLFGDAVPEKAVTQDNIQTVSLRDGGTAPCTVEDAKYTLMSAQPTQARSKSSPYGLGRTYQSAYVAQATDQADRGQRNSSWASSVTVMDSFETMMDSLVDDDTFFRNLDARPKRSVEHRNSQATSDVHEDCPTPIQAQPAEFISGHPEQAQDQQGPREGESFFDEALENVAYVQMDVSRLSPNLTSPATSGDLQLKTAIHGDGPQKPLLSSPTEAASTSAKHTSKTSNIELDHSYREVDKIDDFPIGDGELSFMEEENRLPDDHHGEKHDHHDDSGFQICNEDISIALDPFADEDLDAELVNMSTASPLRNNGESPPFTQCSPRRPKLQWTPPTQYTPVKLTDMPKSSVHGSSLAVLNRTPLSSKSANSAPHCISFSEDGKPSPFIRPSFPTALLPRSPITGLAPNTILRTCFRIGEALNAASVALRNSKDAIVELYCRVKYSDRELNGYKQFFELADLFAPEKPPFLNGMYAIWKGVSLWEYDSRAFLGERGRGKLARVVGRIKRGEANKGWDMTILNVWEATWDDVGIVKGVICS